MKVLIALLLTTTTAFAQFPTLVKNAEGYQYIDTTGKSVSDEILDGATLFNADGHAAVVSMGQARLVNASLKTVFEYDIDFEVSISASHDNLFADGYLPAKRRSTNLYGVVGAEGKWLANSTVPYTGARGTVAKAGKLTSMLVVDLNNGTQLLKDKFGQFHLPGEDLIAHRPNFQTPYTVYTKSGTVLGSYKFIREFSDGLCAVGKENKWGYIDNTGTVVIPIDRDGAGAFVDGIAPTKKGKYWGLMNRKGEWVVNAKYKFINTISEGLVRVTLASNKIGVIDLEEKDVIKPYYDFIGPFRNGVANAIRLKNDIKITTNGKVIWTAPPKPRPKKNPDRNGIPPGI